MIRISGEEIERMVDNHDVPDPPGNAEVDWDISVKGLRNPYRWNVDTVDGRVVIDVEILIRC